MILPKLPRFAWGGKKGAGYTVELNNAELGANQRATQAAPLPAELAQLHHRLIGDSSQRTFSAGQSQGDVQGVVAIGLSPLAAAVGQPGRIGDVDALDALTEAVDEP